ncbi:hypothetical protein N7540_010407 [Penicillium herquei]|nr:hypothetical protein N7540_010407 [Penicillium herquei]
MLALKSGLEFGSAGTFFLVADDLTKRILQRTRIPVESKKEIVVMVTVRTDPRKTMPPEGILRLIEENSHANYDPQPELLVGEVSDKSCPESETNTDGIRVVATRFQRQTFKQSAIQWEGEDQRAHHSVGNTVDEADAEDENSHYGILLALLSKYQVGNSRSYFQEYEGRGFDEFDSLDSSRPSMVLRDPNEAPFTTQNIVWDLRDCPREKAVKGVLSVVASRLPSELFQMVRTQLNLSIQYPLWNFPQSEEHFHIFVMFPATANELSTMTKDLEEISFRCENEIIKFELIPIEKDHVRSRSDVMTFYNNYRVLTPSLESGFPLLILLLAPFNPKPPLDCQVSLVYRGVEPRGPFEFLLTSLFNVIEPEFWERVREGYVDDPGLYHIEAAEVAFHPDQPFYCNPPPWEESMCKERHQPSDQFGSIPVFYLIKHLTEEEDDSIKRDIYMVNDKSNYQEDSDDCWNYDENIEQRKYARFVPWEKQEDGNRDDIFSIPVEVHKFYGLGNICYPFFCIDQEYLRDNRLILVEPTYGSGNCGWEQLQGIIAPTLQGFKTIRIRAKDADQAYQIMADRSLSIEEAVNLQEQVTVHYYTRPGWPPSNVLGR